MSSAMKKKLLKHDFMDQAKPEDSGEVFERSAAEKGLETTYIHTERWHILLIKKVYQKV